jgi:glycosyltransferase involved in cell wall biosynthesis
MSSSMRISIITVCYNAESTLEDTLFSVQHQIYPVIEHVLVDGGSSDGTVDIIRRFGKNLVHWVSKPDQGIYDAMNKGIAMVSGDIVGFLNADDVYADNRVLERVAGAFTDLSIDSCYSDLVYVEPQEINNVVRYWRSSEYHNGLLAKGWCPPHPTFFVKKKIYDEFGGFDLRYTGGNDVELMMRFLAKHRIKSKYLPGVTVKMRTGGVSNRRLLDIVIQNREMIRAARNNGIPISPIVFIMSKIFSRAFQYLHRPKHVGSGMRWAPLPRQILFNRRFPRRKSDTF